MASGPSAVEAPDIAAAVREAGGVVVAVADAERAGFRADYLVLVDWIDQYPEPRRRTILGSLAPFVVSQFPIEAHGHPIVGQVLFQSGDDPLAVRSTWDGPEPRLWVGSFSAGAAVTLAQFLGASTIGVIGHDLRGHRSEGLADQERARWSRFREAPEAVVNLSPRSLVTTIPYQDWRDWIGAARPARP